MNPELWHNISTVFMTAGIIFLIFTVWISAKLNLVSIIQSEINNRKERKNSDENDYFIRNENQNTDEITENSYIDNDVVSLAAYQDEPVVSSNTVLAAREDEPVASNTVLAAREDESVASNTVLAAREDESVVNNTILISSENTIMYENNNEENGDFIISENIIVMHGDPSSIRRKVVL